MPVLVEPTFTDEQTMSVSERAWQGADEQLLGRGHGLGNECGVAADQVDADFLGRLVKRVGDLDEILARLAGAGTDQ